MPALNTLVPSGMASAVTDALDHLISQVGDVDAYVARELGYDPRELGRYFCAEQIDAIALALHQFSRGCGFILGDQTGIGKGRVIAALIRHSLRNGRTPVFVTENAPLYSAMYWDLIDIGMRPEELSIFMSNAGKRIPLIDTNGSEVGALTTPELEQHNQAMRQMIAQGRLDQKYNIIFTTFDQMNTQGGEEDEHSGRKPPTLRMSWLSALIKGCDLYLDESHNAGGTEPKGRGRFGPTAQDLQRGKGGRAGFVRDLVRRAHSTLYSSATWAKRPGVMDLYLATDILKGVGGKPEELPPALARGGIPLQQVLATLLTQGGQYLRRERDFSGIRYATRVTRVNREVAEGLSRIMRCLVQFDVARRQAVKNIQEALDEGGKKVVNGQEVTEQADSINFASKLNNMISQMLLALQVDATADQAIEALGKGQKPVIALANTMGSFIHAYVEENALGSGAPLDLSFAQLMKRYLEASRTVTIRYPGKLSKDDPPPRRHYLTEAELGASSGELLGEWGEDGTVQVSSTTRTINALDAYRKVETLILELTPLLQQIPISPIDWIHHRLRQAGYKSGEITGRQHTLEYQDGRRSIYRLRPPRELSAAAKVRAREAFNSGELDVLIINESGSTGISLHASEKFRDQRGRIMLIPQAGLFLPQGQAAD